MNLSHIYSQNFQIRRRYMKELVNLVHLIYHLYYFSLNFFFNLHNFSFNFCFPLHNYSPNFCFPSFNFSNFLNSSLIYYKLESNLCIIIFFY